ncbi:hypothetical protein ON010_g13378 [Phytophthora cinnamomi]|nr:hypothetical protein ON010_g13378 [Phytophthora cinnamomi]
MCAIRLPHGHAGHDRNGPCDGHSGGSGGLRGAPAGEQPPARVRCLFRHGRVGRAGTLPLRRGDDAAAESPVLPALEGVESSRLYHVGAVWRRRHAGVDVMDRHYEYEHVEHRHACWRGGAVAGGALVHDADPRDRLGSSVEPHHVHGLEQWHHGADESVPRRVDRIPPVRQVDTGECRRLLS